MVEGTGIWDWATVVLRYRFSEFTLSPQRRLLVREGQEVPLIPRYFDLLLLLVERRREAVHRREIFERVWGDVIVSDSALSQAVRTIRRTLGDDSREPRFIRTVSRHGYRFVFPDVIEEEEEGKTSTPAARLPPVGAIAVRQGESRIEQGAPPFFESAEDDEEQRTLRDRIRRAARLAAKRWSGAAAGGALAGMAAGGFGGLVLSAAPGSAAPLALAPVLAVIGAGCGALGAAGVGAGLAVAEAAARSGRALALTAAGALGGGLVGLAVQLLTQWGLATLVGLEIAVGGGFEGLVIGGGAGLGFALATRSTRDGLAAPRGPKRLRAALITALCCGLAGLALTMAGRPLAGGTIHAIAVAADGSRATLAPLGRLVGEPDFGPVSRGIIAFGEGAVFGLGLAYGLVRRPREWDDSVSPSGWVNVGS
jgi:DNA-binding winged helix-turn-helix (wHTH) protein